MRKSTLLLAAFFVLVSVFLIPVNFSLADRSDSSNSTWIFFRPWLIRSQVLSEPWLLQSPYLYHPIPNWRRFEVPAMSLLKTLLTQVFSRTVGLGMILGETPANLYPLVISRSSSLRLTSMIVTEQLETARPSLET